MIALMIALVAWGAGLTALAGGAAALWRHKPGGREASDIQLRLLHGIVAFGGGVLLAAVAFALLPESMDLLPGYVLAPAFLAGGVIFALFDAWQARHGKTKNTAQFPAMLMDFVPEAVSLGAVFGHDRRQGILLAAFIALQNFPEGFNSMREMLVSGTAPGRVLRRLALVSLLGPAAALAGHFFLQELPYVTATLMVFASGGILYLIFQDIAPQSRLPRHWSPTLGAVLGFLLGMIGHKFLSP